mmetsp:Transcript_27416/g.49376  ORF Transcript_27416/g.49376 Transcript_27416/m.49376 type:complete len:142 (+) Transcript_27416:610-1035(+)
MAEMPECQICLFEYNTRLNKPIILPWCGHTICKSCAIDLTRGSYLKCPSCSQTGQFSPDSCTFNISLMDAINLLKRGLLFKAPREDVPAVSYSRSISDVQQSIEAYPYILPELPSVEVPITKNLNEVRRGFDSYPGGSFPG